MPTSQPLFLSVFIKTDYYKDIIQNELVKKKIRIKILNMDVYVMRNDQTSF